MCRRTRKAKTKTRRRKMDEESEPISNEALEELGLSTLKQYDTKHTWTSVSMQSVDTGLQGHTLHLLVFKESAGPAQRLVAILTDARNVIRYAATICYLG
jgi:hypothetical protein